MKKTTSKICAFFMFALLLSIISIPPISANSIGTKDLSISLVNQNPDPAIAGNLVEVRIGIENRGSALAEEVMLEFIPSYPFSLVSSESTTREVGTLRPLQSGSDVKIIKYTVRVDKDAPAGEYEFQLNEYAKGNKAIIQQRKLFLDVKNKESAEIVYINKVNLVPGAQTSLQFTINNVGGGPLRDITFSWENKDGVILPVGSDDTKYVKYIDIDEQATITYDVIADSNAQPGLYKLDLTLKYDDQASREEKIISTSAGVYVGGATDFDIAFADSSKGETSFSIANIGSNPSFSVAVSIPKQENWIIKGSNSVIIGNLNKGDYTLASYRLQPIQGANGEVPLILQIDYTDTSGKRETLQKEILMTAGTTFGYSELEIMNTQDEGFLASNSTLIIVVVLLGAGLFYYKRKHRKK